MNTSKFSVHITYNAPIWCATYADAVAVAKKHGFDAHIYCGAQGAEELAATWSVLGGAQVYNRALTGTARGAMDVS